MRNIVISLAWASAILGTAFYASATGMSDAASYGLTMSLVGAAVASLHTTRSRCANVARCL